MCYLGVCYYYGRGVAKDYGEAVAWYRKAMGVGHLEAAYLLGQCYEEGAGVEKNVGEAIQLYRKSAFEGYAASQTRLGILEGVSRSGEDRVVKTGGVWRGSGCSISWRDLKNSLDSSTSRKRLGQFDIRTRAFTTTLIDTGYTGALMSRRDTGKKESQPSLEGYVARFRE